MSKPVIVIRKLEDSPDWFDRRLTLAYLDTDYRVFSAPFPPVRIGVENPEMDRWLEEKGCRSFVFITAWNPRSKPLSLRRNRWRNKQLETDLKTTAAFVLAGLGAGRDPAWPPEESFLAADLPAETAVGLGRKYGQNALVYREKGQTPELWWL